MHSTGVRPTARAASAEAREITPGSWLILCQRADRALPDPRVDTRHRGWTALPEIDGALRELGYARAGAWEPAAMLGGFVAAVEVIR